MAVRCKLSIKASMDSIRRILAAFTDDERQLYQRRDAQSRLMYVVVVATVAGDAVALGMMVYVSARAGLPLSPSLWLALALPLTLACGALWGTGLFLVLIAGGIASGVLVSRDELDRVRRLVASTFARLSRRESSEISESP